MNPPQPTCSIATLIHSQIHFASEMDDVESAELQTDDESRGPDEESDAGDGSLIDGDTQCSVVVRVARQQHELLVLDVRPCNLH